MWRSEALVFRYDSERNFGAGASFSRQKTSTGLGEEVSACA